MDKKGAKGYWISTAKVINQELFNEYVEKVGPWLKENGGEVFAKDTDPIGKEKTEDSNLAVICEFPSMRIAVEAYESSEYQELSKLRNGRGDKTEKSNGNVDNGISYFTIHFTCMDELI